MLNEWTYLDWEINSIIGPELTTVVFYLDKFSTDKRLLRTRC